VLPLVTELHPPPTVEQALRAFANWPAPILFDSARSGADRGRYSSLSADPLQVFRAESGRYESDPFRSVKESLRAVSAPSVAGLPPFQGGVAGLMSYELGRCWERLPTPSYDEFQMPPLVAGLYDWVLSWDHVQNRVWIVSQGWLETDAGRAVARADGRMREVLFRLSRPASPIAQPVPQSIAANRVSIESPQCSLPRLPGLSSNFSRSEYLDAVARVVEYIRAGDIFQANLSQRLLCPADCTPLELYLRLRSRNPAPFAGYFALDDWAVLSASPERFLQVHGDEVVTRPIKGTRRRVPSPEADLYMQDELHVSPKDIAENTMIVDLLRNDLSRVCRAGSIRVPSLCRVESYETVHHLVSEVRGQLRDGMDVWDLFAATFPGGSITGCPKVRAMEIITELEQVARGPYCGTLFYVGADGSADSSILIRTITQRGGWLQLQAGGGIVAQSNPAAEYEETLHKAEGMFRAIDQE
jgi:para-aminobenzoate synthetase component 1